MEQQTDYTLKSDNELLLEYSVTKAPALKQELTLRYVPIVKQVALQMRNVYEGFTQIDDIINEGVITIMSSLDKFDPGMNVKFESYIIKRLRGMVIDIARKQDWVSRGTRKLASQIEAVTNALYEKLGHAPSDDQIAEALDISKKKYYDELRKIDMFNVISLNIVMDESENRKYKGLSPEGPADLVPERQYLNQELHEYLRKGVECLRDNEKLVISLYYEQDLSIKEIAEIMRVSEPRISQIHGNALKKLRKHMEKF